MGYRPVLRKESSYDVEEASPSESMMPLFQSSHLETENDGRSMSNGLLTELLSSGKGCFEAVTTEVNYEDVP